MVSWRLAKAGAVALFGGWIVSATWDFIAKPALSFAGEALLVIGTAAFESTRQGVYADVGRLDGQTVPAVIFQIVLGTLLLCVFFISQSTSRKSRSAIQRLKQTQTEHAEIKSTIRLLPIYNTTQIILTILMMTLGLFLMSRTLYIVNLRGALERYQAVVAPYQSETERLHITARIRQIEGRESYIALYSDLVDHARRNQVREFPAPFFL